MTRYCVLICASLLPALSAGAETPKAAAVASYTSTTANVSGAPDAIRIDILRWSTDAERDKLMDAWNLKTGNANRGGTGRGGRGAAASGGARGGAGRGGRGGDEGTVSPPLPEAMLATALKEATTVGYLWSREVAGYALRYPEVAKMLIEHGADVNAKSYFVPSASGRGFEGTTPVPPKPNQKIEEFASGLLTPLMFAAREDDLASAQLLVKASADLNAQAADGKDALSLAFFDGSYAVADFLIDSHANVNQKDAQRFTALFWAVDRRNMETAPNFPWMITRDPLPLIKKLLDAGADPNVVINSTPRARMREGSPRIVYATAIMRAAFSGDIELVKLLLAHHADPHIISSDRETTLMAACGTGFINGYHRARPPAERLEVVKLLVGLGEDVNAADSYGITPLMVASNLGDLNVVKYLVEKGANLNAHDLGKKNDGSFGSSVEPLMALDYAIGVGTFVPNNAVIMHNDVVKYLTDVMKERGIKHSTSECTLRGFTCSQANVDPKTATPAEIAKIRKIQIGYQVDGLTGGLGQKENTEK
jgi:ankyrin repeat protein